VTGEKEGLSAIQRKGQVFDEQLTWAFCEKYSERWGIECIRVLSVEGVEVLSVGGVGVTGVLRAMGFEGLKCVKVLSVGVLSV
jgi:hypothetical protein